MAARGITVVDGEVTGLGRPTAGCPASGSRAARWSRGRLSSSAPRFTANSAVLRSLGLEPVEHGDARHRRRQLRPRRSRPAPPPSRASGWPGTSRPAGAGDRGGRGGRERRAPAQRRPDRGGHPPRRRGGFAGQRTTRRSHEHDWEAITAPHPALWSGRPNPPLVAAAADLEPGAALDVACGEGADAIWLAAQGWQVTGVDLAPTALDRAAGHAAEVGADVAARVTWQQADVTGWSPDEKAYDLVTSHFLHLAGEPRRELFARLAAAVAPGGTLLLVGHHPKDLETGARRPHEPDMFFTAEDVASTLDPGDWTCSWPRPGHGPRRHTRATSPPSMTPSWRRAAAPDHRVGMSACRPRHVDRAGDRGPIDGTVPRHWRGRWALPKMLVRTSYGHGRAGRGTSPLRTTVSLVSTRCSPVKPAGWTSCTGEGGHRRPPCRSAQVVLADAVGVLAAGRPSRSTSGSRRHDARRRPPSADRSRTTVQIAGHRDVADRDRPADVHVLEVQRRTSLRRWRRW